MGRLFGTDGVRGLANADLTPELAMRLGRAAVAELSGGERPTAVVGRDPRASGEMLEAAVCAGLTSAGADVLRAGVLPTPALAFLTADTGAAFGVMLSASHNPMPDNGIKLFAAGGRKLSDAVEDRIAATSDDETPRPTGAAIGRVADLTGGHERYIAHLLGTLPARPEGLHVVVDCAHGAASTLAPEAYRRAGATVTALCAEPDGLNINADCGSTHPEVVAAEVTRLGADLGIAHDGDADRCLAVAADGTLVDGDQIMALLAVAMRERGTLAGDTLVATVMSNLGLHQAMRSHSVNLETTAVGDRYVLEALLRGEYSLGGEQSGHIVLPAHATTGDGLLTALQVLGRMAETGATLSELAAVMRHAPQVLINVPVRDKAIVDDNSVRERVAEHTVKLGDAGRVLLRPSGTEPLVRVMVEADTAERAQSVADDIAALVREV